jgi:hypothetical protein
MGFNKEQHIALLNAAELQFRLASAVRIAATEGEQPKELPTVWSHGNHTVKGEEIELTYEECEIAASYLYKSAIFLMSNQIRNALIDLFPNPKNHTDENIRNSYQISRTIRNAFSHNPLYPIWSIDKDCSNKVYEVNSIIRFDTTNLNGKKFEWQHYGGPLAIYKLSNYVKKRVKDL